MSWRTGPLFVVTYGYMPFVQYFLTDVSIVVCVDCDNSYEARYGPNETMQMAFHRAQKQKKYLYCKHCKRGNGGATLPFDPWLS